jgi:hypothetical protein
MANMMYETAKDTPEPGTIKETAFLLLFIMREDRIFRAHMVQASATVAAGSESEQAGKQLQNQMDQFIESFYPYLAGQKEKENQKMKKIMEDMSGTAFKVTRMNLPSFHGRGRR